MSKENIHLEKLRTDAVQIFHAGLGAVEPKSAVKHYCRLNENEFCVGDQAYDLSRVKNIYIVGSGKASAPMAAAMEDILGHRIKQGLVNVKYGHIDTLKYVKLIEAGHPVPDENGQQGAEAILELVKGASADDLVICLISGGGGATIHEINAIRKHLSRVKGGQLAKAVYPAPLVSLMLSDVVGDNLDVIGSGPTVPDLSTFSDCHEIFLKYNIIQKLPEAVVQYIQAGISGKVPETPKEGDPAFDKTHNLVIGSNIEAVLAAREKANHLGYNTLVLSSMIEGETRDVAGVHTAMAKEILKTGNPLPTPACILSGGETTVSITGDGLGGRNQEFVLAAAIDIAGYENVVILSAGTDGNDGPTDAAGAIADSNTFKKAESRELNPLSYLSNNDSYHFFENLGDLLKTGPTNTNVMDLRIMLVN
jgi:hydroxypyruvate reductase